MLLDLKSVSQQAKTLRILHSADWHIGALLQAYPKLARERKVELLKIIEAMLEFVQTQQVDLCLLSGDLFDEGFPPAEEKQYIFSLLEKFIVPVVICMGNHDPLSLKFKQNLICPPNVHIFDYNTMHHGIYFEELSLLIGGASFQSPTLERSLLPAIQKDLNQYFQQECMWKVLCLHGEFIKGRANTQTSLYHPIYSEDLEKDDFDFVGLGHIHKKQSFILGKTLVSYAGCLLGRGFDELGALGFSLIDLRTPSGHFKALSPSSFNIESEQLWQEGLARQIRFISSSPQFLMQEYLLNAQTTPEELQNKLEALDKKHYYTFQLKGKVSKLLAYYLEQLPERLKDSFKHFKIKNLTSVDLPLNFEKLSYLEKCYYETLKSEPLSESLQLEDLFYTFREVFHASEKDSLLKREKIKYLALEEELKWLDDL